MAYYPRSQISIKTSIGGEFIFKDDNTLFTGKYLETSNGLYFEGGDPVNLGRELIKAEEDSTYLKTDDINLQYNKLNPKSYKYMRKREPFLSSKPLPTERDYTLGYFTRYFAKKANEEIYLEINKKLYDDIVGRKGFPDYNLYKAGYVRWVLQDNKRVGDQMISNRKNLKGLEKNFPNIVGLFANLSEYKKVETSLFTEGGELYFADGSEYIGPYHIHPDKGPMEGSQHINAPHRKLYWGTYTKIEAKIPGEYWKYKEGSGPYSGYGPSFATVFFTSDIGNTRAFSSAEDYYAHRDINGFPRDFTDIKEYDKGVYWTDKQDDKNYANDEKGQPVFIGDDPLIPFNQRGTIFYSPNPNFPDTPDVIFASSEEYFLHRERQGYPADFSNILIRDPNRGDRALLQGIGNAIVDAFEAQTGIDLSEAQAAAELEGITLEEYIQNLLGPTTTTAPSTTGAAPTTTTAPSAPSVSRMGGGTSYGGGGGGASSGGGRASSGGGGGY